jgi:hypothetical protein
LEWWVKEEDNKEREENKGKSVCADALESFRDEA